MSVEEPKPIDKQTAAVQTRTARPRSLKAKRRGRYTNSSGFKTDLAILRAQGMSQRQVGKQLGVDQSTVARVEKLPEVQQRITELRELWKYVAHTRLNQVAEGMWDMTAEAIKNRDTKAFDAATRGMYALEKISSSVADTPQRVDVSGIQPSTPTKADIKALLAVLFPETYSPDKAPESSR
jgi:hypothetical protein